MSAIGIMLVGFLLAAGAMGFFLALSLIGHLLELCRMLWRWVRRP